LNILLSIKFRISGNSKSSTVKDGKKLFIL